MRRWSPEPAGMPDTEGEGGNMAIQTVAEYTLGHGGGTFERSTLLPFEPSDGFAVGMCEGTAAIVDPTLAPDVLHETVRRVGEEWSAAFVGTWVMEDGRIAVDPVAYVRDPAGVDALARDRAVTMGRAFGQQAIFSFGSKEVIAL